MDAHPGEAQKFSEVLQAELEQIAKRRTAVGLENPGTTASDPKPASDESVREKAPT